MARELTKPWEYLAKRFLPSDYTPPGAPSPQDLFAYRRLLKRAVRGKRHPHVLILGATPGLRDILFEEGISSTTIDQSWAMITSMTSLRTHSDPNEVIVKANWLNNPLARHYFDVVLGDFVIANIPWVDQHRFFVSVLDLLKPRGVFITRVELLSPDWRLYNLEQTLARFSELPDHPWRAMELLGDIIWHRQDPKTHLTGGPEVIKVFRRFGTPGHWRHPNKKIERLMNHIWKLWKPLEKVWTVETPAVLRRRFESYFTIIAEHRSTDYINAHLAPIWMGRPK